MYCEKRTFDVFKRIVPPSYALWVTVKNVRTLNGVDEHRPLAAATTATTNTIAKDTLLCAQTATLSLPSTCSTSWLVKGAKGLRRNSLKMQNPSRTSSASPPPPKESALPCSSPAWVMPIWRVWLYRMHSVGARVLNYVYKNSDRLIELSSDRRRLHLLASAPASTPSGYCRGYFSGSP